MCSSDLNTAHQGLFDLSQAHKTNISDIGIIRFGQAINLLKTGIVSAQRVNTVSPQYARDIQTREYGRDLEVLLQEKGVIGINNGVWMAVNPQTQHGLAPNYSIRNGIESVMAAKLDNMQTIQYRFGLNIDREAFLIVLAARLDRQKGIDLLVPAIPYILGKYPQAQFLVAGQEYGDEAIRRLRDIANLEAFRGRFVIYTAWQNLNYYATLAGGLLNLSANAWAPYDLVTREAFILGTPSALRRTGGLAGFKPYDLLTGEGEAFTFDDYHYKRLIEAIELALDTYYNRPLHWRILVERGMKQDFSWEQPAQDYLKLYDDTLRLNFGRRLEPGSNIALITPEVNPRIVELVASSAVDKREEALTKIRSQKEGIIANILAVGTPQDKVRQIAYAMIREQKADVSSSPLSIPPVVIVAGVSGAGKTTLLEHFLENHKRLFAFPVLLTTRQPRSGETPDEFRSFTNKVEFLKRKDKGELILERESHGHWYGLEKEELRRVAEEQKVLIFDTTSPESMGRISREFPHTKIILVIPRPLSELRDLTRPSKQSEMRRILGARMRDSGIDEEEIKTRVDEAIPNLIEFSRRAGENQFEAVVVNDEWSALEGVHRIFERAVISAAKLSHARQQALMGSTATRSPLLLWSELKRKSLSDKSSSPTQSEIYLRTYADISLEFLAEIEEVDLDSLSADAGRIPRLAHGFPFSRDEIFQKMGRILTEEEKKALTAYFESTSSTQRGALQEAATVLSCSGQWAYILIQKAVFMIRSWLEYQGVIFEVSSAESETQQRLFSAEDTNRRAQIIQLLNKGQAIKAVAERYQGFTDYEVTLLKNRLYRLLITNSLVRALRGIPDYMIIRFLNRLPRYAISGQGISLKIAQRALSEYGRLEQQLEPSELKRRKKELAIDKTLFRAASRTISVIPAEEKHLWYAHTRMPQVTLTGEVPILSDTLKPTPRDWIVPYEVKVKVASSTVSVTAIEDVRSHNNVFVYNRLRQSRGWFTSPWLVGATPSAAAVLYCSSPSTVDIEKVKQFVRKLNPGLCFSHSLVLIKILKILGEEAVLMGMYKPRETQAYHYYVHTKSWGPVNIYPEGYSKEPLTGVMIEEEVWGLAWNSVAQELPQELLSEPLSYLAAQGIYPPLDVNDSSAVASSALDRRGFLGCAIGSLAALALGGNVLAQAPTVGQNTKINPEIIRKIVELLSQLKERRPNLYDHTRAAEFITSTLALWGYSLEGATETQVISRVVPEMGKNYTAYLAGILPCEEKGADNIVLCAHFDAVGPGADDNASGVAATLELARLLRQGSFKRNIYFLFTGDEESNELGVSLFIADMHKRGLRPENTTVISIDSIGYAYLSEPELANRYGVQIAVVPAMAAARSGIDASRIKKWENENRQWIAQAFPNPPFALKFEDMLGWLGAIDSYIRCDAGEFAQYGYRALTISGILPRQIFGNRILNSLEDKIERVDFNKLNTVSQWLLTSLIKIAQQRSYFEAAQATQSPRLILPPAKITTTAQTYNSDAFVCPRILPRLRAHVWQRRQQRRGQLILRRDDFTAATSALFRNYGLEFKTEVSVSQETFGFLRTLLAYIAQRWPGFTDYIYALENPVISAYGGIDLEGGKINYGLDLDLAFTTDAFCYDANYRKRYVGRQIVMLHEGGHASLTGFPKNISDEALMGMLDISKQIREEYANMLPAGDEIEREIKGEELFSDDFAWMFLYGMTTPGIFLMAVREMGERGLHVVHYVDLSPSAGKRRGLIETWFKELGVKPFEKQFPLPALAEVGGLLPVNVRSYSSSNTTPIYIGKVSSPTAQVSFVETGDLEKIAAGKDLLTRGLLIWAQVYGVEGQLEVKLEANTLTISNDNEKGTYYGKDLAILKHRAEGKTLVVSNMHTFGCYQKRLMTLLQLVLIFNYDIEEVNHESIKELKRLEHAAFVVGMKQIGIYSAVAYSNQQSLFDSDVIATVDAGVVQLLAFNATALNSFIRKQPFLSVDNSSSAAQSVESNSESFMPLDIAMARIKELVSEWRINDSNSPVLILLDGGGKPGKSELARAIDPVSAIGTAYGNRYKNLGFSDLAQDVSVVYGDRVHEYFDNKKINPYWQCTADLAALRLVLDDTQWFIEHNAGDFPSLYGSYFPRYLQNLLAQLRAQYGLRDRIVVFDEAGSHSYFHDILTTQVPINETILVILVTLMRQEVERLMAVEDMIWFRTRRVSSPAPVIEIENPAWGVNLWSYLMNFITPGALDISRTTVIAERLTNGLLSTIIGASLPGHTQKKAAKEIFVGQYIRRLTKDNELKLPPQLYQIMPSDKVNFSVCNSQSPLVDGYDLRRDVSSSSSVHLSRRRDLPEPSKALRQALKKLERYDQETGGESYFSNFNRYREFWGPHFERTRLGLAKTALHSGRGLAVIIGAAPYLLDIPLEMLATFREIVFIDIKATLFDSYRIALAKRPEFMGKVSYLQFDVTTKIATSVRRVEKIYQNCQGDFNRAMREVSALYHRLAEEPLAEVPLAGQADLAASLLVGTLLTYNLVNYTSYLQRKGMGGRAIRDDKMGVIRTVVDADTMPLDKIPQSQTLRLIHDETACLNRALLRQHFEFLRQMVKDDGDAFISLDTSAFHYHTLPNYRTTGRLLRAGTEQPTFMFMVGVGNLTFPQYANGNLRDLFTIANYNSWDWPANPLEGEAFGIEAASLKPIIATKVEQQSLERGVLKDLLRSELKGFDPQKLQQIERAVLSQDWPSEEAVIDAIRREYDRLAGGEKISDKSSSSSVASFDDEVCKWLQDENGREQQLKAAMWEFERYLREAKDSGFNPHIFLLGKVAQWQDTVHPEAGTVAADILMLLAKIYGNEIIAIQKKDPPLAAQHVKGEVRVVEWQNNKFCSPQGLFQLPGRQRAAPFYTHISDDLEKTKHTHKEVHQALIILYLPHRLWKTNIQEDKRQEQLFLAVSREMLSLFSDLDISELVKAYKASVSSPILGGHLCLERENLIQSIRNVFKIGEGLHLTKKAIERTIKIDTTHDAYRIHNNLPIVLALSGKVYSTCPLERKPLLMVFIGRGTVNDISLIFDSNSEQGLALEGSRLSDSMEVKNAIWEIPYHGKKTTFILQDKDNWLAMSVLYGPEDIYNLGFLMGKGGDRITRLGSEIASKRGEKDEQRIFEDYTRAMVCARLLGFSILDGPDMMRSVDSRMGLMVRTALKTVKDINRFAQSHPDYEPVATEEVLKATTSDPEWQGGFSHTQWMVTSRGVVRGTITTLCWLQHVLNSRPGTYPKAVVEFARSLEIDFGQVSAITQGFGDVGSGNVNLLIGDFEKFNIQNRGFSNKFFAIYRQGGLPVLMHLEYIKAFIESELDMDRPRIKSIFGDFACRLYIAVSDPEVNGRGFIDAEGVVTAIERSTDLVINYWEIKQQNRGGNPRFIGVGRQLLFHALNRELKGSKDKYSVMVAAPLTLLQDMIVAGKIYTRRQMQSRVNLRVNRNLEILKKSSQLYGFAGSQARIVLESMGIVVPESEASSPTQDATDSFFSRYYIGKDEYFTPFDFTQSRKLSGEITKHNISKIMVVGDSLRVLPFYLWLLGREVIFLAESAVTISSMQERYLELAPKAAREGFNPAFPLRIIQGEIGRLNLTEHNLQSYSFSLISLIDLACDPVGDPRQWFLKIKELLEPDGYALVDEHDYRPTRPDPWDFAGIACAAGDWVLQPPVIEVFFEVFPHARRLNFSITGRYGHAEEEFHNGLYKISASSAVRLFSDSPSLYAAAMARSPFAGTQERSHWQTSEPLIFVYSLLPEHDRDAAVDIWNNPQNYSLESRTQIVATYLSAAGGFDLNTLRQKVIDHRFVVESVERNRAVQGIVSSPLNPTPEEMVQRHLQYVAEPIKEAEINRVVLPAYSSESWHSQRLGQELRLRQRALAIGNVYRWEEVDEFRFNPQAKLSLVMLVPMNNKNVVEMYTQHDSSARNGYELIGYGLHSIENRPDGLCAATLAFHIFKERYQGLFYEKILPGYRQRRIPGTHETYAAVFFRAKLRYLYNEGVRLFIIPNHQIGGSENEAINRDALSSHAMLFYTRYFGFSLADAEADKILREKMAKNTPITADDIREILLMNPKGLYLQLLPRSSSPTGRGLNANLAQEDLGVLSGAIARKRAKSYTGIEAVELPWVLKYVRTYNAGFMHLGHNQKNILSIRSIYLIKSTALEALPISDFGAVVIDVKDKAVLAITEQEFPHFDAEALTLVIFEYLFAQRIRDYARIHSLAITAREYFMCREQVGDEDLDEIVALSHNAHKLWDSLRRVVTHVNREIRKRNPRTWKWMATEVAIIQRYLKLAADIEKTAKQMEERSWKKIQSNGIYAEYAYLINIASIGLLEELDMLSTVSLYLEIMINRKFLAALPSGERRGLAMMLGGVCDEIFTAMEELTEFIDTPRTDMARELAEGEESLRAQVHQSSTELDVEEMDFEGAEKLLHSAIPSVRGVFTANSIAVALRYIEDFAVYFNRQAEEKDKIHALGELMHAVYLNESLHERDSLRRLDGAIWPLIEEIGISHLEKRMELVISWVTSIQHFGGQSSSAVGKDNFFTPFALAQSQEGFHNGMYKRNRASFLGGNINVGGNSRSTSPWLVETDESSLPFLNINRPPSESISSPLPPKDTDATQIIIMELARMTEGAM